MRPCTPASLFLAAMAALLPTAAPAHAEAPPPACATADEPDFPLTTRLHGGPDTYRAGGGFGTWYLELTNTTGRSCGGIHPVVVLYDDKRALRASQTVLEFYTADRELPHPVRLETTDEDELVGALADDDAGFEGFTVGAGRTLTVKVRLALTSDAVANEVVATAAIVQRHEGDGDWVGQSDEYRFRIETGSGTGPGTETRTEPGTAPGTAPEAEAEATGPRPTAPAAPTPPAPRGELAGTGDGTPVGALATAAATLLAGGMALLRAARRHR
ncbi:hypothetical protein [Streptomyces prasinopilosus]|uniref:Gram-positive cocci surface proteins LPxTG domain-containing protein n=1 Tax=Streptomyces prasinopilosus TaxID=67344 RepID=A0A1G6IAD4_9ACTN|nr:hypothetical protein [Streptomyces prasinopilosus]SDC03431.1 hypothetical protein SAMN05216505_101144 [Streptomyces prasinopilosus]